MIDDTLGFLFNVGSSTFFQTEFLSGSPGFVGRRAWAFPDVFSAMIFDAFSQNLRFLGADPGYAGVFHRSWRVWRPLDLALTSECSLNDVPLGPDQKRALSFSGGLRWLLISSLEGVRTGGRLGLTAATTLGGILGARASRTSYRISRSDK